MDMTESREERPPRIGGYVRDPNDEIEALQSLLDDVYRDAGDGRTLLRELVQNADDARAQQLTLTVLEEGWHDARNSLLHGPALLVANDGPFLGRHHRALYKAIGGSKKGDVGKIGTFGIGLKSVFHICEAFLYIGAADSQWRLGVLNPWCGTGERGEEGDPLFHDWDSLLGEDQERLHVAIRSLLGETNDGLLLWIPLRRDEHDRGTDGYQSWLSSNQPSSEELCAWFANSTPAALRLAQCGPLRTIEARHAPNPTNLDHSLTLMRVSRRGKGWLGRYREGTPWFSERLFCGEVDSKTSKWSVIGVESLGNESLSSLQSEEDWPLVTVDRNGRHARIPRKALAHAAVTVLRPTEADVDPMGLRLRWAVFLPLDDHPDPRTSTIVESNGSSPAWEIILHGYFWPSQDRRSIPGVTDNEGDGSRDAVMRKRWNHTLCDELLLPLLPRALAAAVDGIEEDTALSLLKQVDKSDMLENRMPSVTRRNWLLPVLGNNRVHWKAIAGDASPVLSIRNWSRAPEDVRERFLASCSEAAGDTVFIEETAPRLSGELGDWTVGHLERLLDSIPVGAFASVESLRWIAGVANHILGPDGSPEDARMGVFIRWLAQRIGERALDPTNRKSFASEIPEELRDEWRNLCKNIPDGWLVETDVDSRQAVQELANCDGILGKGLFLLPVGRRQGDSERTLDLDIDRLDRALVALGNLLQAGGESERLRRSRLRLTETLLSARLERHMDAGLRGLPILRATRLPDEIEEAWSVADLRRQIENRRVFDRGYKSAAEDLSTALDAPVWLVSGDAVASIGADVPTPEPEALADAVLHAREFAEPSSRRPLLRRLVSNVSGSKAKVHLAARMLLAGHAADVVGLNTELFQARGEYRRALLILLRLLDGSWRAVVEQLADSLSQDTLEALSVRQADLGALHRLLDECLEREVDWTVLRDEEALLLLKHSYSVDPASEQQWRRMPLHRNICGTREAFDDHAVRSNGRTDETDFPSDLLEGKQILDPDS